MKSQYDASTEITLILNGVTDETLHLIPVEKQSIIGVVLNTDAGKISHHDINRIVHRYKKIKSSTRGGFLKNNICFLLRKEDIFVIYHENEDDYETASDVSKEVFFEAIERVRPRYIYIDEIDIRTVIFSDVFSK